MNNSQIDENPYSTAGRDQAENVKTANELKADITENLSFTAKIVKAATVCCFVATAIHLYAWIAGFSYLAPMDMAWTWLHTLHVFRGSYVVAFALLTWRGSHYSKVISLLPIDSSPELARYVESQAYLWLAVGFLIFIQLAGMGLSFSAAFAI